MSFDHSIENLEEAINNRTKKYFQEVYQSYAIGNYRSCIVILYSVLIYNLVYKLRNLRDIYGDKGAEKILKEIEDMQRINPRSSEWENKLVELIKARTSLPGSFGYYKHRSAATATSFISSSSFNVNRFIIFPK